VRRRSCKTGRLQGGCDRHAAAVRALDVGLARIAHGLQDALAAVDADAVVQVRTTVVVYVLVKLPSVVMFA
jgi:hypothetical protein